jgi:ParE toxin of type II toxin-antitoxin system, parDE
MNVEFLQVAETELANALKFYNSERKGLGFEFVYEIKQAIDRIVQFPDAWQKLSKRARRCRTKKFPYGVIYQNIDNLILIVAIMHLHKEPNSWKNRV